MEQITLKQDDQGNTVQVVTNQQTNEVPFSSDEIKRQITQHAEVIQNLQQQLQAVQTFESNDNETQEITISDKIDNPIIDSAVLESVSKIEVKEVEPIGHDGYNELGFKIEGDAL